ncbi:MAG TPA: dihydrofolate reductase family protein [Pseudonocardiaceae bacterium]|nr:dihydrofolate reductase family protein [Pseudonocardiaceae bacterium]
MLFSQAIPPGGQVTPEDRYTRLDLSRQAGEDRPYVVCNFVSSLDGKATAQGRTSALGGDADRTVFHLLRTQADALLAGTGTLRIERYGVGTRNEELAQFRLAEGRTPQPLVVVISRSGNVPFEIPLFADSRAEVALYAPADTAIPACAARVTHHHTPTGEDDLSKIMRSLRRDHQIRSLLCEGGPILFNSLLRQSLVDELFLTLSPTLTGGDELGITTGPALQPLQTMDLEWVLECDGSLFLRYVRRRQATF